MSRTLPQAIAPSTISRRWEAVATIRLEMAAARNLLPWRAAKVTLPAALYPLSGEAAATQLTVTTVQSAGVSATPPLFTLSLVEATPTTPMAIPRPLLVERSTLRAALCRSQPEATATLPTPTTQPSAEAKAIKQGEAAQRTMP